MRAVKLTQYGFARSSSSRRYTAPTGKVTSCADVVGASGANVTSPPARFTIALESQTPSPLPESRCTCAVAPVLAIGTTKRVSLIEPRPCEQRKGARRQDRRLHERQAPAERDRGPATQPVRPGERREVAAVGRERPVDRQAGRERSQLSKLALERLAFGTRIHQRACRRSRPDEEGGTDHSEQTDRVAEQRQRRFGPERTWHRRIMLAARWTTG